jgi:thioester reductase-like protein
VLRAILDLTAWRVLCLVRSDDPPAGRARLAEALHLYGLAEDRMERVEVVCGDLGSPGLGLAEGAFNELAGRSDAIVHSGARVHWLAPFEDLVGPNVEGTREVIRLAATGPSSRLHHVSSIGVFPYRRDRPVAEDDDLDHGEVLFGGYTQSKWVAEKLAVAARATGLAVSVHRPGTLVGSSTTGHFSRASFLDRLFMGSVQLGAAPALVSEIEMTPVDYAARALVAIASADPPRDGAFNLTNPQPVDAERFRELAGQMGYEMESLPFGEWRDRLLADPGFERNALKPFRLFLGAVQENQLSPPPYSCDNALAALEGSGVECPPFGEALLRTYFGRYAAEGFVPPPR